MKNRSVLMVLIALAVSVVLFAQQTSRPVGAVGRYQLVPAQTANPAGPTTDFNLFMIDTQTGANLEVRNGQDFE